MISAFLVVKLIHVLLAIIAVGFTITFGSIMALQEGGNDPVV